MHVVVHAPRVRQVGEPSQLRAVAEHLRLDPLAVSGGHSARLDQRVDALLRHHTGHREHRALAVHGLERLGCDDRRQAPHRHPRHECPQRLGVVFRRRRDPRGRTDPAWEMRRVEVAPDVVRVTGDHVRDAGQLGGVVRILGGVVGEVDVEQIRALATGTLGHQPGTQKVAYPPLAPRAQCDPDPARGVCQCERQVSAQQPPQARAIGHPPHPRTQLGEAAVAWLVERALERVHRDRPSCLLERAQLPQHERLAQLWEPNEDIVDAPPLHWWA